MTGIWLTSDIHVAHAKVSELRGFSSTDEHDAELARCWDAVVRPVDQVWLLGDVTGRRGDEARGLEWVAARPGIKHLIAGNHDPCHGMHTEAHKVLPRYLEVFASVQQSAVRKIAGERVLLSHFPYSADHTTEARYPEWRFPDTGRWLVHGHTHSTVAQRGRELHVGLDAHDLKPVSLHWIEERITKGLTA
ncbi:metallophosphoesterase [Nocardia sp. NPDC049707]|uniref:metallophosphoesterase n=1 Tax=Nocardia sp. NPDC049707 TaxID=3154735 RepID=UPI0034229186